MRRRVLVPSVTQGSSFTRAGRYFLRDKGAESAERVAWSETLNMRTDDPQAAIAIMAWTARHGDELKRVAGYPATGRKLAEPVYQFSLSWHPEEKPDRAEMLRAAGDALAHLRMQDRQAIIVCHNDEPQPHIHVIVNRVHPENGRAAGLHRDYLDLSKWAEKWEREHGKIYCRERVRNNERRKEGRFVKQRDPAINRAWQASDNGRSFAAALITEGYFLARGDKQEFVIVDPHGKAHNPARQIEGARAKDIRAKLADLDPRALPSAAQARARQGEEKSKRQPRIWDREAAEVRRQKRESDAALAAAAARAEAEKAPSGKGEAGGQAKPPPRPQPQSWDEIVDARQASPELFEEWANAKRASQQSYFLERRGELLTRHAAQRDRLTEDLQRDYGAGLKEARQTLSEIEERMQRRGIRTLLYRLTGRAAEDQATAEATRATLTNIEWRITERKGALATRQREEIEAFQRNRDRDDQGLEHRIASLRAANENAREPEPEKPKKRDIVEEVRRMREAQRQRDRGRERDFDRER
jgi:hypothetical protein